MLCVSGDLFECGGSDVMFLLGGRSELHSDRSGGA